MANLDQKQPNRETSVLVVSNVTVDETYSVGSIPLPGQSLIGQFRSRSVGGKGANVATILSRAGIDTHLVAGIGTDERSAFVRSELKVETLNLMLQSNTDWPTDVSIIYTDVHGENSIATTVSSTQSIDLSKPIQFLDVMQTSGWLVLQGNLTRAMTESLMQAAIALEHRIVFNPSPCAGWMKEVLDLADVIVMNSQEAHTLTCSNDELAVTQLLQNRTWQVALTRGAQGATLATRTDDGLNTTPVLTFHDAVDTTVVDTTGAGDTWLATALASAIKRNTWLDELALQHAANAAAITVGQFGTRQAFPDRQTMEFLLSDK